MNLNKLMGGKRKINDKKERLVDVIVIYKDGRKQERMLDYYPYELDEIFNFFTYSFMDLIKEIKVRTGGQFWTTIFKDGHVHYDIYDNENGWQTVDYDFVPEKGKSSYDYVPRGSVSDSRRVSDGNNLSKKLSKSDIDYLLSDGNREKDIEQIQEALDYATFEIFKLDNNYEEGSNKEVSFGKAINFVGREGVLSALARAAFHHSGTYEDNRKGVHVSVDKSFWD